MARRKFHLLKTLLYEKELTQDDLADALGKSRSYVEARFNARQAFTFDEVIFISELLGIDDADWRKYFTEGAKA